MSAGDQHWYAIINPAAGNGRSYQQWDRLKARLEKRGIQHTEAISKCRGHIAELAGDALTYGYTHFISIGGDGSHHELVNGLLNASTNDSIKPVVAILNAGSGNDWARTHGIGSDLEDCVRMIDQAKTISHPAGVIRYTRDGKESERCFVNVAGMALDGRAVETYPESLRHISILPGYLIAGLRTLLFYKAPLASVESDAHRYEGHCITINAGFGRYSGGGMQFVPHADPAKSTLAVTYIQRMPKWRLLANIYRLYFGTILAHPRATGFHANHLSVTGEQIPLEADGEFLGYTPVHISVIPNAFRLIVP